MNKPLPAYYRQFNRKFFKLLPKGMNRVLEFGCSAGFLGRAYKEQNPGCVWHGVEIVEDAAAAARENIDDAWVLNANDLKPTHEMLAEKYDAVIYADVIEHLIDPIKSLPSHLDLVKPGGELLACIPNVQHWTIMKQVLRGDWTYTNSGLLDNTHLRFFTRKSIYRNLKTLNLDLVQQERYSHEDTVFSKRLGERDEILGLLKLTNEALGQPHNELDFRTFQYGIRARKS